MRETRDDFLEKRLMKDRDELRQFLRDIKRIAVREATAEHPTMVGRRLAFEEIRDLVDAALCGSEPLEL